MPQLQRRTLILLIVGLLTVIALVSYLRTALPVATGLAAKQLCSAHFVSRLPRDIAQQRYVEPLLGPLTRLISWRSTRPQNQSGRASSAAGKHEP